MRIIFLGVLGCVLGLCVSWVEIKADIHKNELDCSLSLLKQSTINLHLSVDYLHDTVQRMLKEVNNPTPRRKG